MKMSDEDQQILRDIMRNGMNQLNSEGVTWTEIYNRSRTLNVSLGLQPQNLFDWQFKPGEVTDEDVRKKFARVDEIQLLTGWPLPAT